jgi:hypothetical protein
MLLGPFIQIQAFFRNLFSPCKTSFRTKDQIQAFFRNLFSR